MVTEVYRDSVVVEVEQRPGGGALLRVVATGKDSWEGSSNVLSLTPTDREWLIKELQGTL